MKRSVWIAMVLAACDGGDGGKSPDRVDTILSLTGDPVNGAEVYGTNCSSCHGPEGVGLGDTYPSVVGLAPEDIAATVLDGVPDTLMIAYADILTDQEIADIIAHIDTL
jgi:mono/diheme cytochrome c family protein